LKRLYTTIYAQIIIIIIELLNSVGNLIVYNWLNYVENKENKLLIKEYIKSIKNINKRIFCHFNGCLEDLKFLVKWKLVIWEDYINNNNNRNRILKINNKQISSFKIYSNFIIIK
jgi:hypothetical protein